MDDFEGWLGNHLKNQRTEKIKEILLKKEKPLPEPDIWFHDIFQKINGSPYKQSEIDFIKTITKRINNHLNCSF